MTLMWHSTLDVEDIKGNYYAILIIVQRYTSISSKFTAMSNEIQVQYGASHHTLVLNSLFVSLKLNNSLHV